MKLTEVRGAYYGGVVAAPVTRATLEAALATRSTPLDRGAIAATPPIAPAGAAPDDAGRRASGRTPVRIVDLRGPPPAGMAPARLPGPPRELPDIAGMSMRDGVRRLHAGGFRVKVIGSGRIRGTQPEPGARIPADSVVRVLGERSA